MFAASLPGQGFLSQIKSDPNLASCEIQTVGIRLSPRHKVNERVFIDNAPGTLVDISSTGAHVVCECSLKPGQRLFMTLHSGNPPLTAFAVWVQFEIPREGPRYRAGVEFAASAALPVAQYISGLSG